MTFEERIDRLAERQTALHRTLELAIKSKQSPTERSEDLLRRNG
jgi:hypothetical protein